MTVIDFPHRPETYLDERTEDALYAIHGATLHLLRCGDEAPAIGRTIGAMEPQLHYVYETLIDVIATVNQTRRKLQHLSPPPGPVPPTDAPGG